MFCIWPHSLTSFLSKVIPVSMTISRKLLQTCKKCWKTIEIGEKRFRSNYQNASWEKFLTGYMYLISNIIKKPHQVLRMRRTSGLDFLSKCNSLMSLQTVLAKLLKYQKTKIGAIKANIIFTIMCMTLHCFQVLMILIYIPNGWLTTVIKQSIVIQTQECF